MRSASTSPSRKERETGMHNMIKVSGLHKAYGSVKAVRGIDLTVEHGSLFAFLGVNGAGKSTTIDILSTLLKPDSGEVRIDGHLLGKEDDAIRSAIGIVFQDGLLDALLTVEENLSLRGAIYGLKGSALRQAVHRAVDALSIGDILKRPYGKLSGGQRRRADVARALINAPRLLFLDEPTTGLDPKTRKNVWETIHALQKDTGMTVFLTTHYMEEAAQADAISVIQKGVITAQGTPQQLKEAYSSDTLCIKPYQPEALTAFLTEKLLSYTQKNGVFTIPVKSTRDTIPLIAACGENIENLEVLNGTMDDVFIHITGEAKHEILGDS